MQLGVLKDQGIIDEYVGHLQNAITVAKELKGDPANSKYAVNLNVVILKLEKIVQETRAGKIVNDIAGMTKFAGDWPIAKARLAMAIWEAEKYFSEKILRIVMTEMGYKR